jgi:uncharacterized protein (DUF1330 family)
MRTLEPKNEALMAMASDPDSGPVTMINLLRFKTSQIARGTATVGASAVYDEYLQKAAAFVSQVGGRLLWKGEVNHLLIGEEMDNWDRVLLVEYPSAGAFLSMFQLPGFAAAQEIRKSALEETVLLAAFAEDSGMAG